MTREKVSLTTVEEVTSRDGFRCVAPVVDPESGPCHDRWGQDIERWPVRRMDRNLLTIAHVKDGDAQSMGKRAPSDANHLVLLCWGHHEGAGERRGHCWGTKREGLEALRAYLGRSHGN